MVQRVAVEIGGDPSGFKDAIKSAKAELTSFTTAARSAGGRIKAALSGVPEGLRLGIKDVIDAQKQLQTQAAKTAAAAKQTQSVAAGFSGIGAAVRAALPAVTAFASILATIKTSDNLANLQAQLKRAAGDAEGAGVAFRALFDEAQKRGTSLEGIVKIYSELSDAARGSGTSQEALLSLTTAVNDAFLLSGKSAEQAAGAIDILSVAMVTGTVSSANLNTLYKQTPELIEALAKGTGKSVIELKKLATQGKLTPQALVEGMIAAKDDLAKQADQLPLTFERAFQKIKNSLLKLIGPFQAGLSQIAGLIGRFADYLSSDETLGKIENFVIDVMGFFTQLKEVALDVFNELRATFPKWVDDSTKDFEKFASVGEKTVAFLIGAFKNMPANIRAFVKIIVIEFATMFDSLIAVGTFFKEAFAAIFNDDTAAKAADRMRASLQRISDAKRDDIAATLDQRQATIDKSEADAKASREANAAQKAADKLRDSKRGKPKVGKFDTPGAKDSDLAKLRDARLDAEDKLNKDINERSLRQLEFLNDQRLISTNDFLQARTTIELQAIDQDIEIQKRRMSAGGVDAIKAQAEITLLEKAKTDVVAKESRERIALEKAATAELIELKAQDLEALGRSAEAAGLRLDAEFKEILARYVANGDKAGEELARRVLDRKKFAAQFDQIQNEFDVQMAALNAREQSLANQAITGALPQATAESQINDVRRQSIAVVEQYIVKLTELSAADQTNLALKQRLADAEILLQQKRIDAATGVQRAIFKLRAELSNLMANFATAAADAGVDAFTNLLLSIADRSKSAKEKLRDFALGFAQSMAQIAARALATAAVLTVLNAIPGFAAFAGAAGAASGAVTAGTRQHRGGMAGHGPKVRVHPLAFAGAPRFHNGGSLGLKSDEVPSILQTGEEVLSRKDPRNAANGGSGQSIRIINNINPDNIHNAMSNTGGERVIMNAIKSNPKAVRQILNQS